MRFKLDENLDAGLTTWLAAKGHDAHSVREENLSGAADETVFAAARREHRCLITLDLDFADPFRLRLLIRPEQSYCGRRYLLSA